MSQATIELATEETLTSSAPRQVVWEAWSAAASPAGVVLSVPRSQMYYWSQTWQENERIALEEIARGDAPTFGNARDALRWLMSDDD
jgi:hypothetical protein